jgi:hypothetical protein
VKHEIVVERDDPLHLILYLFAQDIYVRNVQPISLYWPDHLPLDEEEVEEEVTPEHFHISYNPPAHHMGRNSKQNDKMSLKVPLR